MCKSSSSKRSQVRAGHFRSKNKAARLINVLDAAGSLRTIEQRGRLNITSHSSALNVLEKKVLRYLTRLQTQEKNDNDLINNVLRGVGDDDAFRDIDVNTDLNEIQQILEEKKELLQVIGTTPSKKPSGVVRLASQNTNGLPAHFSNNSHLDTTTKQH